MRHGVSEHWRDARCGGGPHVVAPRQADVVEPTHPRCQYSAYVVERCSCGRSSRNLRMTQGRRRTMGTPLVTVQFGLVNAPIAVGSAEWFVWLDGVDAFTVEEHDISFTAQRAHDGASALWLAFCAIENEPRCIVLGSAPELTRERLLAAAHQLAHWDTVTPEFQVELDGESGPMPRLPVTSPDLLVTKLEMPLVDEKTFVRTRAIDRMDHVLAYPLTIINAPSGYGKSTLVATWARETSARVAWLLLDENDNDPMRFSTHLLAAL